ncbi:hypothetical protein ADUPG1_012484 [Aduncisulcus paluster]|uniref:Uncharacterized protein n=1 Tax=Aduncisulcus paluster TaxID=2918883 RepID=A0ABQ5JZL0_9EUKA|nr:hypothetical protein ADUPG1_012484 [Aduncisulcus paluster]
MQHCLSWPYYSACLCGIIFVVVVLSIVLIVGIVFAIIGTAATDPYYQNLDDFAHNIGTPHTIAQMQDSFAGGYVRANYLRSSYDSSLLYAYPNDFTWDTYRCDVKMTAKDIDELSKRGVTFPLDSPYGSGQFNYSGYPTLTEDVFLSKNTFMSYAISNGISSTSFDDIQIEESWYDIDYSDSTSDPCKSSYQAACGGDQNYSTGLYEYTCFSYEFQNWILFSIDVNHTNDSFSPETSNMSIPSSDTFTDNISGSYIMHDDPFSNECGTLDRLPGMKIEIWAKNDPCAIFAVDYEYSFGADTSVFTLVGWIMVGIGGGGIIIVILTLYCCINASSSKNNKPFSLPPPIPDMIYSPLHAAPTMMEPVIISL